MRGIPALVLLGGCILTEKSREFEECISARPDATTTMDLTCVDTTPGSLDFDGVWANTDLDWPMSTAVTRSADVDGDGDVDGGDPMVIWANDLWDRVVMFDADGNLGAEYPLGAWRAYGYAANFDSSDDGSEYLASWSTQSGPSSALMLSEVDALWATARTSDQPFVTDLEDDGVPEVIIAGEVFSGADGSLITTLDGTSLESAVRAFAADLDGDGVREILSGTHMGSAVKIYAADGSEKATCYEDRGRSENIAFAVGNFDADDDGEFVAAGTGFVVLCDADGTLLASYLDSGTMAEPGIRQPNVVAIGELDGDPDPEIVVGDETQLLALEHDLTLKWEYVDPQNGWYVPSLADLDMDGRHEILVDLERNLLILDGDANLLVEKMVGGDGSTWMNQPIVADVDGDGLAEIVVPAYEHLKVMENVDGGWNIPEARYPWPGQDRHPAQQDVDGSILPASAWWLEPGGNVFNGLPAGPAPLPELAVVVEDLCLDCAAESTFIVAVSNQGAGPAMGNVELVVTSTADGSEIARVRVPTPLAAGVVRYVNVEVTAGQLTGGLTLTVGTDDLVGQCDATASVTTWEGSPCAAVPE